MAAAHDRVEVIELLLAAGTPVDALDGFGRRALQAAAENGRPESVRMLLAAGANPQQQDPNEKLTPLEWSQRHVNDHGSTPGHEQVQRLLTVGAAE